MKKNILIFCSWFEVNTTIGIFFEEQAELISSEYNPILVVFKKNKIKIKDFYKRENFKILEKRTQENILVLEVYYPISVWFFKKISDYFDEHVLEILNDYLNQRRITISFVHAHSLFNAGIWAYKYYIKYRIPYILTEHNQLSFFNVGVPKCELIKKTLQYSSANLVVSNDKIRQFVANGLFFDFINIGNLINKKFFYNEFPVQNNKVKLITVGAFSLFKDQKTILNALKIVDLSLTKNIEFIWIGYDGWGGDHNLEVENLLKQFHFKNIDIVLIPLLNRDNIAEYLRNVDLFLFSSLSEGMPVSVLEALASGLPVFTSNCGGVDEIINKDNGVIFQIKDYQSLSVLILKFLNQEFDFKPQDISNNILQKFGESAFKDKLLSIYNNIT